MQAFPKLLQKTWALTFHSNSNNYDKPTVKKKKSLQCED
jgi:hypothetical protein